MSGRSNPGDQQYPDGLDGAELQELGPASTPTGTTGRRGLENGAPGEKHPVHGGHDGKDGVEEDDEDDLVVIQGRAAGTDPDPPRYGQVRHAQHEDEDEYDEDGEEIGPLLSPSPTSARRPSVRQRSSTLGSLSFSFSSHILPLPASQEIGPSSSSSYPGAGEAGASPERALTLINGCALVIGMQIGSGIFSTPGVIVREVGSVGAALMVWAGAGLLAWTGASSFAELGAAIPENGGAQKYLDYALGEWAGYLFACAHLSGLSSVHPSGVD